MILLGTNIPSCTQTP